VNYLRPNPEVGGPIRPVVMNNGTGMALNGPQRFGSGTEYCRTLRIDGETDDALILCLVVQ